MIVRAAAFLAAAVVVLGLAGCASAPAATPRVTPAPTATRTPAATPAPRGLPGCADFVAPTAFGTTLGADVVTPVRVYPFGDFAAIGGVACELQFGEQGFDDGAELMYQIVPASIATPAELSGSQAEAGTPVCQTDPNIMRSNAGCEAVLVLDGWWIETHFSVNSSAQVQTAAVQPILNLIRTALQGRRPPAVVAPTAPSCDRFASAVSDAPGHAGATVTTSPPSDSVGDTRAGWPAVAVNRVVPVAACLIDEKDGSRLGFSVVRSPEIEAACAATTGATAWPAASGLTIASTPYVSGGADLCATDGISSITTSGASSDENPAYPMWDASNVAAITSLLAKLLAAAR